MNYNYFDERNDTSGGRNDVLHFRYRSVDTR